MKFDHSQEALQLRLAAHVRHRTTAGRCEHSVNAEHHGSAASSQSEF